MSLAFLSEFYCLEGDTESVGSSDDGEEEKEKEEILKAIKSDKLEETEQVRKSRKNILVQPDTEIAKLQGLNNLEQVDYMELKETSLHASSDMGGGTEDEKNQAEDPTTESRPRPNMPSTVDNLREERKKRSKRVGSWPWSYKKKQLGRAPEHRHLMKSSKIRKKRRNRIASVTPVKVYTHPLSVVTSSRLEVVPETDKPAAVLSPVVRKVEKFKCPFCFGAFSGKDSLINHLLTHQEDNQTMESPPHSRNNVNGMKLNAGKQTAGFRCSQCGFHFKDQSNLKRHMKLHSEVGRPWKCSDCGCRFALKGHLTCHEDVRHGKKQPNFPVRYKCSICNYSIDGESAREEHMRIHEEKERPWKCSRCPSYFLTSNTLRRHEGRVHDVKVERVKFPCKVCGKVFHYPINLAEHMNTHKEARRPWKCSQCPSFFTSSSHLRLHENRYHDRKPGTTLVPCHDCGKYFPPSHLGRHMASAHESGKSHTKDNSASLDDPQSSQLKKNVKETGHLKKRIQNQNIKSKAAHHPNHEEHDGEQNNQTSLNILNRKSRKCIYCRVSFCSEHYLQKHMKFHKRSKDRPLKCSWCPAFFGAVTTLRKHETQIHKKNLGAFKCPSCEKRFTSKESVDKHLRKVHGYEKIDNATVLKLKLEGSDSKGKPSSWQILLKKLRPCDLILTRCDHLISKYDKKSDMSGSKYEQPDAVKLKPTQSKRIYTCPYCFEQFLAPELLIAHLSIHEGGTNKAENEVKSSPNGEIKKMTGAQRSDSKQTVYKSPSKPGKVKHLNPFKCSRCNYSCHADTVLQTHMRLHSEEGRPFKCSQCSCCFFTFNNLRAHEGRFHRGSNHLHPMIKCQHCSYSNRMPCMIKMHMKIHEEKGRPFKCSSSLCRYRFETARGLKMHNSEAAQGKK